MNEKLRENLAKYFYDLSKGVLLVLVIGSFAKGEAQVQVVISGFVAAMLSLFLGIYIDIKNK